MIRTEQLVPAGPDVVHDLLTDIGSWAVWSPHIAWVKPRRRRGDPRRWSARWHFRALAHRLRYENLVVAAPEGARVTFTATLEGPAAGLLTLLARPLSAHGQRRRIARLGRLAALVEDERRQGSARAT